ncbi:kinase-like domain-containing protein [Roridomyces roridus]|uniref:Kinase-like domain-containing protein n=1 Tax=Roridomyces roridus TaxID=1738132 RepID=A0AAD7FGL9_9AGAR|nr:kinase-like domain-containing protein [Roridomyces roridus]
MRHFLRGSQRLYREALRWKGLDHPNILPFIGLDTKTFPNSLCMVSPWMEHGTVLQHLNLYSRANVNKLLFEIAQGIQYLHSRNIVHGDLRGVNILIKRDWVPCLADFGLSAFTDLAPGTKSYSLGGGLHWMAPELIDPTRFGLKFVRTPATDIYAFGCVCFELYTGRPPFFELSEAAALFRVIGGERAQRPDGEPRISDDLWSAITTYWAEGPTSRPTIETVLQNPIWPILVERESIQASFEPVPLPQRMSLVRLCGFTYSKETKAPEVSKSATEFVLYEVCVVVRSMLPLTSPLEDLDILPPTYMSSQVYEVRSS